MYLIGALTKMRFGHLEYVTPFETAGHILCIRVHLYAYARCAAWTLQRPRRCETTKTTNKPIATVTKENKHFQPVFCANSRTVCRDRKLNREKEGEREERKNNVGNE